jgi:hypothetical protein
MRARLVLGLALGLALGSQASRTLRLGTRGIAVPLSKRSYEQAYAFVAQVERIRSLGCRLPIEVWEAGDELDTVARGIIGRLPDLRFRNLDGLVPDLNAWRGWQIKGAIPRFTAFDELLLMDGDIGFASNPEALFETPEYRATGTYFFRDDQSAWRFFVDVGSSARCKLCQSRNFYNERRKWLQKLFGPTMPAAFPPEWAYHWREGYEVNATKEVMDSGVVALDRRRHPGLVQHVFRLNEDKAETYQHVWGDKETFWLAALLAGEPFAFHPLEARHECLSLLAYDVQAHSSLWRHHVKWNSSLAGSGHAVAGTKLRGLIQRDVAGRALYYHRKNWDVPLLSIFTLQHNDRLCTAGWAIAEQNSPKQRGFALAHPLARMIARRFEWEVILTAGLILWWARRRFAHRCDRHPRGAGWRPIR